MTETTAKNQSAAVDEQATADAPEAQDTQDTPGSMPTAEAVAAGSADPGPSSAVAFSDRGVVSLDPAPLTQFELARSQGYGSEPVYPEGHEEMLAEGGGAVGVQNYQADQEIVASNPAIAELFETTDAGEQNSAPSQAGPSSESSVVASGESEEPTSQPETGTPAASTASSRTGSTSTASKTASKTSGSTGSTSDSGSTSSSSTPAS